TIAGVALTLTEALLLWLVLLLGQAILGWGSGPNLVMLFLLMTVLAVCGFAGGLFGSAFARSTLGAVGWGIVAQSVAIPAGLFFAAILSLGVAGALIWPVAVSLGMLLSAALRYTSPDRRRQQSVRVLTAAGPPSGRVLLWLAWRQGRGIYW